MIHWNLFFLYQMNKNDVVVLGTQVCLFEGIKYSTLPWLPLSSSNIKHLIRYPHSQMMALLPIEARRHLPLPGGLTMTSYLHQAYAQCFAFFSVTMNEFLVKANSSNFPYISVFLLQTSSTSSSISRANSNSLL